MIVSRSGRGPEDLIVGKWRHLCTGCASGQWCGGRGKMPGIPDDVVCGIFSAHSKRNRLQSMREHEENVMLSLLGSRKRRGTQELGWDVWLPLQRICSNGASKANLRFIFFGLKKNIVLMRFLITKKI